MPASMRVSLSRAILPIAGYWNLLLALSIQAQAPTGDAEFLLPAVVLLGLPLVVFASRILFRDAHASGSILAMRDDLTGIANRRAFTIHSQLLIRKAKPGALGLILLDVDRLKTLNDTCGHQAGDELLEKLAKHISSRCKLYRIGGDEFAILVDRSTGQRMTELMPVLEPFLETFDTCGHSHEIRVSFGSTSNRQDEEFRDLFGRADDSLILHKCQQSQGRFNGRPSMANHPDTQTLDEDWDGEDAAAKLRLLG